MSGLAGEPARLLLLFGLLSLAAVVTGAVVCAASGVPAGSWLRNLAAWSVGGLLAGLIAAKAGPGANRLGSIATAADVTCFELVPTINRLTGMN